jgi:opacity protein-like surface antigen
MKKFVIALIAAVCLAGPAAAASWPYSYLIPDVQGGGGRGQGGGGSGQERGDSRRDGPPRQERRAERDERRDRLSDDDRRALHRDLDKANRELYRRRDR